MIKTVSTFVDCNSSCVEEFVMLADNFCASLEYEKAIEKYSEALSKPFNRQATTCKILMRRARCYENLFQLEVKNFFF